MGPPEEEESEEEEFMSDNTVDAEAFEDDN